MDKAKESVAGRRFEPTEEDRAKVSALASFGVTEDEIAVYIGIAPKTLRKHFRKELDVSHIGRNLEVARSLYSKAISGDTTAMIFWLKTRARWRESSHVDVTNSDRSMASQVSLNTSKLTDEQLEAMLDAMETGDEDESEGE